MAFRELVEKRNELAAKQDRLAAIFAEAKDDHGDTDLTRVKSLEGDTHAKADTIQQLMKELDDLGGQVGKLAEVERAEKASQGFSTGEQMNHSKGDEERETKGQRKSIGQQIMESEAIKNKSGGVGPTAFLKEIDLKTLFETGAGWEPESTRSGIMIDAVTQPLQMIDLIPSNTIGQPSLVYMEETTYTPNAQEVAEGGLYPEATFALTERTEPVRKIGVWIPVTDEQLQDVSGAGAYLDRRLRFGVQQRLDGQIADGNGTAPNLEGILNRTGLQTEDGTDETSFDAIYRAIRKVRVTGRAQPSGLAIHPEAFEAMKLERTTDGIYILGNPSQTGPMTIWGMPIAENEHLGTDEALVGDFSNFSELYMRRGLEVQVTNSHDDFFINGKQAMRADMRVALAVYRPSAFVHVTNLGAVTP